MFRWKHCPIYINRIYDTPYTSYGIKSNERIRNNIAKRTRAIESEKFSDIRLLTLKSVLEVRVWDDEKLIVDACIKWVKKRCEKHQLDPTIHCQFNWE